MKNISHLISSWTMLKNNCNSVSETIDLGLNKSVFIDSSHF